MSADKESRSVAALVHNEVALSSQIADFLSADTTGLTSGDTAGFSSASEVGG